MLKSHALYIYALVAITPWISHAEGFARGGFSSGPVSSYDALIGDVDIPKMSRKVSCMLQHTRVKKEQADETAYAVVKAAAKMGLPSDKFSFVSLMHFLAQIRAESAAGANTIEDNPKSSSVRGYGFIQVTGPANLLMVSKCMNEIDPGSGNNVVSSPATTIGKDPYLGALSSLCWWKRNIAENNKHCEISKDTSVNSCINIHKIVNTGSMNSKVQVTGGNAEEQRRVQHFNQLMQGEKQCRDLNI